jgi:hypothetical protein
MGLNTDPWFRYLTPRNTRKKWLRQHTNMKLCYWHKCNFFYFLCSHLTATTRVSTCVALAFHTQTQEHVHRDDVIRTDMCTCARVPIESSSPGCTIAEGGQWGVVHGWRVGKAVCSTIELIIVLISVQEKNVARFLSLRDTRKNSFNTPRIWHNNERKCDNSKYSRIISGTSEYGSYLGP